MPMMPAAGQAANSLRETLVRRGYLPDDRGVLTAPLSCPTVAARFAG